MIPMPDSRSNEIVASAVSPGASRRYHRKQISRQARREPKRVKKPLSPALSPLVPPPPLGFGATSRGEREAVRCVSAGTGKIHPPRPAEPRRILYLPNTQSERPLAYHFDRKRSLGPPARHV